MGVTMQINKYNLSLSFALILCAVGYYLYTQKTQAPAFDQQKHTTSSSETIVIRHKTLTAKESLHALGKDITKNGYTPIRLSIKNDSQRYWKFSTADVSLKVVTPDIVAANSSYNTTKRVMIWGIVGLCFPLLWAPGIIHAAHAYSGNKRLKINCLTHAATDRIIAPHTTIDSIIFVNARDFSNQWTMILSDNNSDRKIVCDINMENKQHAYMI
jgi:hypothetical protein